MKKIIQEDAINWLNQNTIENNSIVASMPDYSEFPELTLSEWKDWFKKTAQLILEKTSDDGVSIFYQSDIKYKGEWVDKSFLCQLAAHELNHPLLFHKIICRVPAGMTTFGRPAYSHIICFSKNLKLDVAKSTPDVITHVGEKLWERGMGVVACEMIAKFIKEQTNSTTVINPFCGLGSLLSVLEAYELNSIGIERSLKRAKEAEKVKYSIEQKKWVTT